MKQLLLALIFVTSAVTLSAQNVDTVRQEQWVNNAWQNESRFIYTYNADCQVTSLLFQNLDSVSQTWQNSILFTYSYTAENHISETLFQNWNGNTSTWENLLRTTNTYNASFQLISYLNEFWLVNNWQSSSRGTYSYDANGRQDSFSRDIHS